MIMATASPLQITVDLILAHSPFISGFIFVFTCKIFVGKITHELKVLLALTFSIL